MTALIIIPVLFVLGVIWAYGKYNSSKGQTITDDHGNSYTTRED